MALSQKHRKLQGGFEGGVLLQMEKDRENKCYQAGLFVFVAMHVHLHQLMCKYKYVS